MKLQQAIKTRRSIRDFTDYQVTDEEIRQLMEAAQMAPSWANSQCWEFIIVRDKQLIEDVTNCYSENNRAKKCSSTASLIIVGYAKKDLAGFRKGVSSTKFNEWFMYDLASAVQNISLTAHELGLGSVLVGLMNHDKLKELLEIPNEYEVVVAMPIGKPTTDNSPTPKRKDIDEFAYLNKYGNQLNK